MKIDADDVDTWQSLQYLMELHGFRSGDSPTPTKRQVDKAWEHLKGRWTPSEPEVKPSVKKHRVLKVRKPVRPSVRSFVWVSTRSGQLVKQASRNLRFNGKFYRKGQFVPKDLPKDFI